MSGTRILAQLVALLLLCANLARGESLLAFTAISLSDAMEQIGADFERKTDIQVRFNFQASSALIRQIIAGAPADLFISADEEKMDQLQAQGLIVNDTRVPLLSNELVLITTPENTSVHTTIDLTHSAIARIAIAQPDAVPAGIYARRYLQHIGLWAALEPKFIPTENVRVALSAVMSGNADAGFVFKTDALSTARVRIAYEIPAAETPPIVYPAAIVKDAPNERAARAFLAYLSSDAAGAVFEQFGFKRLSASEP